MESDFDHIEVGEGVDAAVMTVISANQSGQGDYLVTGLAAGSQHSYALRSVDHAGNRSDWSAVASVTVASAVSPEEVKQIQKDLADNQTALKDNTAKLTQAQKDIQANKTGLDAANQTLSQAKADLSQARKDIAQTKSDLTTANGEISKAKESVAQAYAEAHSKNHTFRGPDEPKDNLIVGDLWLKTQKYWTRWKGTPNNSPSMLADFYTYWTGTPNNSPSVLVPLSDRVVDTLVWDGSAWNHMGYATWRTMRSRSSRRSRISRTTRRRPPTRRRPLRMPLPQRKTRRARQTVRRAPQARPSQRRMPPRLPPRVPPSPQVRRRMPPTRHRPPPRARRRRWQCADSGEYCQ